ncbi:MAG: dTDP-4-dehydrorhamnose reductase [Altererythrobacter sp. XM-24bin4]|uniref:dTDP-4-dehydrorhamnose reductase n=1 Tax=uncultured Altererythrobacter sp. TaxID=500840 RepID=UPI000D79963A|nr:dTDP-4-dehydrorhamnose reductase [uncultured Altererythrobacter sp.]PWL25288.1 MAG: dTDP-4-dehydrorhamnose reductase [Altererythrobacter sp. XM-24bin4]
MTILVFGKTGQVAQELQVLAPAMAPLIALGRDEADLAVPGACTAAIEDYAPTAVINAAAYTAVDRAEEEEELAARVNGAAPAEMARACAARDIPFVHLSTDYVLDGSGDAPWRPDSPVAPISSYGRSKLVGERGVVEAGGCYAILRTSWVFSAHGQNFVKTMLRLGPERDQLRVVADQIGGPTPAAAITRACLSIAEQLADDPAKRGTYHFAGAPDTSWADFARAIFVQAGLACEVQDIGTSDYPTPARRPANSRLDCSATEAVFGIKRPNWQDGLAAVLQDLKQKDTVQ